MRCAPGHRQTALLIKKLTGVNLLYDFTTMAYFPNQSKSSHFNVNYIFRTGDFSTGVSTIDFHGQQMIETVNCTTKLKVIKLCESSRANYVDNREKWETQGTGCSVRPHAKKQNKSRVVHVRQAENLDNGPPHSRTSRPLPSGHHWP